MRYRVLEKADLNGEVVFIPQYQRFFMWMDFFDFDFPPRQIKFHSLESATKFVRKQISKPKEKVVYITEG
jgi:hypothetical protein